jgi:hypothetical protein
VECPKRGLFSAERRAVFPVFVIWKHSLKMGLSKSRSRHLMVVDLGQLAAVNGESIVFAAREDLAG